MGIIPPKVIDQLAFFNQHAPVWASNSVAIGLTVAQTTAFTEAASEAQGAWDNQQTQKSKTVAATADMRVAVGSARTDAASLIALIKAFAENTENPQAVYTLAEIPAPAAPSPVGPPGTPFEPRVELLQTGAIVISWKCANPTGAVGTIYEITRRLGASGNYTLLGGTGVRSFTDDSIPSGSSSVFYQVTGVRSTSRGPTATFTVQFGVDGPGLGVTDVTTPQVGVKMAA